MLFLTHFLSVSLHLLATINFHSLRMSLRRARGNHKRKYDLEVEEPYDKDQKVEEILSDTDVDSDDDLSVESDSDASVKSHGTRKKHSLLKKLFEQ